MTGDFNIRDSIWNLHFPYYSFHRNTLFEVTNSLHLELSRPTEQVPTRYLDNQQDFNLVINLMFLRLESMENDNNTIYPNWRLTSDHAPLTINISIFEEHIQTRKWTLVKKSKEEESFIKELIKAIKKLNIENIQSKEVLEQAIHLQVTLKIYGINTQKSLISPNIQRSGRMRIVIEISRPIDSPNKLKIGNDSRA